MRQGKDNLINKKYQDAVTSFQYALIEEPQNKDAQILLEKANSELELYSAAQILDKYEKEINPLLDEYLPILNEYSDYVAEEGKIIRLKHIEDMDKLQQIIESVDNISGAYSNDSILNELNNLFSESMDALYERMEGSSSIIFNFMNSYPKDKINEFQTKIDEIKKYR